MSSAALRTTLFASRLRVSTLRRGCGGGGGGGGCVVGRLQRPLCTSSAASSAVQLHVDDVGVATLTLNDPRTRNALSLEVLEACREAVAAAAGAQPRALVLRSTGAVFSSGHNLKHLAAGDAVQRKAVFDTCEGFMRDVDEFPAPTIAVVGDGGAHAAGLQLVATCCLAFSTDAATFSTPGVKWGLFCHTPAVPTVRCIPMKVAADMLFTGRPISGAKAARVGLLTDTAPTVDDLEVLVADTLAAIVANPADVVAMGKRVLRRSAAAAGVADAYAVATPAMVENLELDNAASGIEGFVGKHRPKFT